MMHRYWAISLSFPESGPPTATWVPMNDTASERLTTNQRKPMPIHYLNATQFAKKHKINPSDLSKVIFKMKIELPRVGQSMLIGPEDEKKILEAWKASRAPRNGSASPAAEKYEQMVAAVAAILNRLDHQEKLLADILEQLRHVAAKVWNPELASQLPTFEEPKTEAVATIAPMKDAEHTDDVKAEAYTLPMKPIMPIIPQRAFKAHVGKGAK